MVVRLIYMSLFEKCFWLCSAGAIQGSAHLHSLRFQLSYINFTVGNLFGPLVLSLLLAVPMLSTSMECLYSFICLLWSFLGNFPRTPDVGKYSNAVVFLLLPFFPCSPEWIYGHPESYGWRGCGSYFVNHHHHRLTRFFDVIVNELLKRRAAGARSFDSWLRRWHFVC